MDIRRAVQQHVRFSHFIFYFYAKHNKIQKQWDNNANRQKKNKKKIWKKKWEICEANVMQQSVDRMFGSYRCNSKKKNGETI